MTLAVSIAQSGANNVTMRNRIINGAMMIDQRNNGASVTVNTDFTYVVDRFNGSRGGSTNSYTMQQSTTAPTGFKNSLLYTMGTGVAVGTTNYAVTAQAIEGLNVADFNLGTASSAPFTLSFWVRSSVTGTFGVAFRNSAAQATYCATYTISSANTFEYKTVTVPAGAINSGTWLTTNGIGMNVIWDLGVGSTYSGTANQLNTGANYFGVTGTTKLSETTGATFYITGVQLEKGTTATPFEQRLYGTELALCQRYCQAYRASNAYDVVASLIGIGYTTSLGGGAFQFKQEMRAAPTMTKGGNWRVCNYAAGFSITNWVIDSARTSNSACEWNFVGASGLTVGAAYYLQANNDGTAYFILSAEL